MFHLRIKIWNLEISIRTIKLWSVQFSNYILTLYCYLNYRDYLEKNSLINKLITYISNVRASFFFFNHWPRKFRWCSVVRSSISSRNLFYKKNSALSTLSSPASIVLYFIYIPTFHRHLACLSVCPLFFL